MSGGVFEKGSRGIENMGSLQMMRENLKDSVDSGPLLESGVFSGVSTGSTLLNLACSGNIDVGFPCGHYTLMVGDPTAGKTLVALNALAEACLDPTFHDYTLVYDNVEGGCMFDLERIFHKQLANRLKSPRMDGDEKLYSTTVEEFYYNLDDCLNDGPVIYVLDSMDALTADDDNDKFDESRKANRSGKQVAGSFGTAKAKLNSVNLRRVCARLREKQSILVILAQTRDNLGFGFEKKTRSGGKSLKFYASLELWASVTKTLKVRSTDKDRQIGVMSAWKAKKNRLTGLLREVEFPIYPSYGIDDIGSCVDFLVAEGFWKKNGTKIAAEGVGLTGKRDALIRAIESQGLILELRDSVQNAWDEIEESCKLKRVKRYSDGEGGNDASES